MSNLLDERDKRTKNRKKVKEQVDALINLSVEKKSLEKVCLAPKDTKSLGAEGGFVTHRLLDEGAILYADGQIDCFIAKGTIEKYLNGENEKVRKVVGYDENGKPVYSEVLNLTNDYIGTVNYGHHDLATDPIALIGEWQKKDLHIVDIENGRTALDVDVRLDEDHIYVKQLRKLKYDVGLSAEFWCHYDPEKSEQMGFGVIDEIFIGDFAVVGECGNVNSSDLRLKGGLEMPKDKELEVLEETLEEEKIEEITEETEVVEETIEEAEKDAEIEEMSVESAEETAEITESVDEVEDSEDETEDEVIDKEDEPIEECVEEVEDEEDTMVSELVEVVKSLKAEVASLKAENGNLKEHITAQNKTMNRLRKKLKARNEEASKFIADFKNLSVEMEITKEEPKDTVISNEYLSGDGIGE